jgi:hypothetical protein
MNQYFGIQDDEDVYVQEVGELACSAPLLDGWVETKVGGEVKYRCGEQSGLAVTFTDLHRDLLWPLISATRRD